MPARAAGAVCHFSEARILTKCAPQQQPLMHEPGKLRTKGRDSARTATGLLTQMVRGRCLKQLPFLCWRGAFLQRKQKLGGNLRHAGTDPRFEPSDAAAAHRD